MAEMSNRRVERLEMASHAIRRAGAKRILQVDPRFLKIAAQHQLPLHSILITSFSSHQKCITAQYYGRRRKALYNERTHEVETPDDEGLHLFFAEIFSPARVKARQWREELAERVSESRSIVSSAYDEAGIDEDKEDER